MFLSAVWTLNLTAPIHCRGYNTKFLQICSDEQTNSFTYACKWEHLKIKGAVHRYYPLSLFIIYPHAVSKMYDFISSEEYNEMED